MYIKKSLTKYSLLVILSLVLFNGLALPEEKAKKQVKEKKEVKEKLDKKEVEPEPVIVDGDTVEYFQDKKKVVANGNVTVNYQNMKLTADHAIMYPEEKKVTAKGNVVLTHKDGILKGEKVNYDFNTDKGKVVKLTMEDVGPWQGKSNEGKYTNKSYLLKNGYITTCDLEKPHYKLKAKRFKVYLNDKIVAKHVTFNVKNVPVMYLPYYAHPISDNRPRVTIIPGHSSDWGHYLLTAWRYVLSPIGSGRIYLDYREFKGFAQGFDTNYNLPDNLGEGKLRFYYTHEHDKVPPNNNPSDTWKERYRVQLKHKAELDKNTSFRLEYHKMKDEDFIKDYYYDEEYKREHQPDSYLSLIHSKRKYNLSLQVKKRMNRFFIVTERLPEIKFNIRENKIGNTPFYLKNKFSLSNLTKKYADSSLDYDTFRFDTYNEISHPLKVFNFLNIEPWTGVRQTYYTKDSEGDENRLRGIFYTGLNLSTKFYKIFDVNTNFMNFDINKLRHIVTPTIEYKYIHDPTIFANQLRSFDSIDDISRKNLVTLGLENRFQTKRGNKDNEKIVDLGYFRTTIDYNFKPEYGSTFENLKGDLEFSPYDRLRFESDFKFNPRTRDFETVNFDTVFNNDNYEVGIGHRYQQDTSSQVTAQFKYYINKTKKWKKKWILDTYVRFESETKEWEEIQVKLTKDMHCWLADFIYNYKDGLDTEDSDNHSFFVVFRMKAFPTIPFKLFETSYEKPKPESE